jgi:hypothetical protein
MKVETRKEFRIIARNVFWFHLGWILMVFAGTIFELFYHPYAKVQFWIVVGTFVFQLLGRKHCPLTLFENLLLEKSDSAKMYSDKETYDASFIRHCLKKFLNINAPRGTTTTLLVIVLLVTMYVLCFEYSEMILKLVHWISFFIS